MIEVLVSLLLLAVAMLGFVALQTLSVKATSESVERVKALTIMQNAAEKIRTNSGAMAIYKTEFSELNTREKLSNKTPPSKMCGLSSNGGSVCNTEELAKADVYLMSRQFVDNDLVVDIVDCPQNSARTGVLQSNCMIAAWGDTLPSVGNDADVDCLKEDGKYYPKASCMFMEMN